MAVERPDVERLGMLAADAVVPCLCMLIILLFVEVEDWRECEEATREWPALAPEVMEVEVREEAEG